MLAILTKGLPWSGKSTRCEKEKEKWFLIISKDIIRKENVWIKEQQVHEIQIAQIKEASVNMQSIIIDNTHMNPKTLKDTMLRCATLWYEVLVKDMWEEFEYELEYLDECHERNLRREEPVPPCVIDEMYLKNYKFWNDYYIFDIDGTLATMNEERRECLRNKDYEWFYWPLVLKDTPIEHTILLLQTLVDTDANVIIMSWRSNESCLLTKQRLADNWIDYDYLLMRQRWDHRQDWMVKKDLYEKCLAHQPWRCLWVFDDREQVMKLRRNKWLFVFDVSQGNRDF